MTIRHSKVEAPRPTVGSLQQKVSTPFGIADDGDRRLNKKTVCQVKMLRRPQDVYFEALTPYTDW